MKRKTTRKKAKRKVKKVSRKKVARKKVARRKVAKKKIKRKAVKKRQVKKKAKRKVKKTVRRKTTKKKRVVRKKKTVRKKVAKKKTRRKKTVKKKIRRKKTTKKKKAKKKIVKKKKKAVRKKATKKKVVKKKATKKKKSVPKKKELEPIHFVKEAPKKRRRTIKYPVLPGADSEVIKVALPILKELKKKKKISDWVINLIHARKANIYAGKAFEIEDQLEALTEDVVVTIYQRYPDNLIGEVRVPITSPSEAKKLLNDAVGICEYSKKKAFELPDSEELTFPKTHDEKMREAFFDGNGMEISKDIFTNIQTLVESLDVKTNFTEILCSAGTFRVMNSNGVDVSFHKTSLYLEVGMSHKNDGREEELVWKTTAVSPGQLDLGNDLAEQATHIQDATKTTPAEKFEGDVLLAGQSLIDFFSPDDTPNPVILHTFAKLHALNIAQLRHNEPIGEFEGEPFTLSTNPHLSLGSSSMPVDEMGVALQPVELIRTGVFANHLAPCRHAQFVGVPVTGEFTNLHISDGATREEHLRGNNYVEIVKFSWFNPDPYSGDFSAEIRLGYKWLRGKKTPFKGGHFTGNVFKNLLNAHFSREVHQKGSYYGPRAMLFKNAKVTKRQ